MSTVVSRDGTRIAFTRSGRGPAVILVDGALSYRAAGLSGPLAAGRWDQVTVPTLVLHGGKSHAWVGNAAQALADALPNAEHRTLQGQTHIVKPQALAPVLVESFTQATTTATATRSTL
jgi:pimeloyl-ACP methyl ester carboxylesterase